MDGNFKENDISRIIEADRAHIWHHLSQHKPYETSDPKIIVEGKGILMLISLYSYPNHTLVKKQIM